MLVLNQRGGDYPYLLQVRTMNVAVLVLLNGHGLVVHHFRHMQQLQINLHLSIIQRYYSFFLSEKLSAFSFGFHQPFFLLQSILRKKRLASRSRTQSDKILEGNSLADADDVMFCGYFPSQQPSSKLLSSLPPDGPSDHNEQRLEALKVYLFSTFKVLHT